MSQQSQPILAFNRGVVSNLGRARSDVPRLRLAAKRQTNWMPRVLGSMMLRPGWEHIEATKSNAFARTIVHVRSAGVYARLELTNLVLRVLIDDELVTRPAVTAAVTNGSFTSNIASWTDADESGGASTHHASGYAQLLGDGTAAAILRQQVTVNEAGTEHALRVVIARGPVMFRVGSTSAGEEYIGETQLGTGTHSLAFTPSSNFHIQISSAKSYPVLVDSINVEAAGVMEVPTPWTTALIPSVRHAISGDVIYVVDGTNQQRKIERRGAHSWSVVLYEPETGPFRVQNVTNTTITPSGLTGAVTLTASKGIFRTGHVGALFRLASVGQSVAEFIDGQNQFTDPIRVSGTGETRRFGVIIEGSFTATVTLQYSVNEPGAWIDISPGYASEQATTYLDGQDNQVIYYRLGVKTGDYTIGALNATLNFSSGSIQGIARITGYQSVTVVDAVALSDFGATTATTDWWEGRWSDYRGHPSAVGLLEGRLWMGGFDRMDGSISDAYEDFDDELEGDAGPISRSIGEGPVERIHWILALGRLVFGTALNSANVAAVKIDGNSVMAARSSSQDEPLTPSNFTLKAGSARGIFVDRSQQRLFELAYSVEANDYVPEDLTVLVPDFNRAGIAGVAVQMKPDVRLHCWRNDGTVGCLVFDRAENVICWIENEAARSGNVEDVSVVPGTEEDSVYYIVERVINSGTVRYHEKWALESECTGRPDAYLADCHYRYSGSETTTITGLGHLEAEPVVVWGWNTATPFTDADGNAVGRDLGTFTVAGGQISGLPAAVTNACVGLAYTAQWQSAKAAFADAMPLSQRSKVAQVGFALHNTHYQGIKYGKSFAVADLRDLPTRPTGAPEDTLKVWENIDTPMIPLGGNWSTDPSLCLQAASPRPANIIALVAAMESGSKP